MISKKIILVMIIIITTLLITTIFGFILNMSGVNLLRNLENKTLEVANSNDENINIDNTEEIASIENIQELRMALVNRNMNKIVSRSEIDRQKNENIYVNLTEIPQEDYEELITYTKLEDIKISFNMDVSKTTGLSKEDFVHLVQNMKYDKTGILEKNAAWIWECCQKYSVNEIFVLGICGIESAWCAAPQHQNTHNYSSLMKGGKLISYSSDEAGFEAMIKLLGQKYLSPKGSLYRGSTITGVGTCYCNTTTWPKKVYTCMQQVFK